MLLHRKTLSASGIIFVLVSLIVVSVFIVQRMGIRPLSNMLRDQDSSGVDAGDYTKPANKQRIAKDDSGSQRRQANLKNGVKDTSPCLAEQSHPATEDKHRSGTTVKGEIAAVGDQESWKFTVETGDIVRLQMGTASGNLRPRMRIFSPTLQLAHDTTCSGTQGGSSTLVSAELPITTSGTYSIICMDDFYMPQTGTYNLSIVTVSTNAGPLKEVPKLGFHSGSAEKGEITATGNQESWKFTAEAGDVVRFQIGTISGNLRPRMRIYTPTLQLAHDTTCIGTQGGRLSLVSAELPIKAGGTYSIICMDDFHMPQTGKYNLSMVRIGPSSTPAILTP